MLLCVAGTLKEKFDGKSIIWSAGESSSSIPFDVTFYFRHQADLNLITAPMGVLLYSSGERKKKFIKDDTTDPQTKTVRGRYDGNGIGLQRIVGALI